jgi:hypothetical protein
VHLESQKPQIFPQTGDVTNETFTEVEISRVELGTLRHLKKLMLQVAFTGNGSSHQTFFYTDKKRKQTLLIFKEIRRDQVQSHI